jgi:signal peptidase II
MNISPLLLQLYLHVQIQKVKYSRALFIVLIVIILDQVSKIYVKTHFLPGEDMRVLGDWFHLHFIENEGMAYGMKISEGVWGKLALSTFRLGAVIFGFYLLKRLINKGYKKMTIVCGALILAGALGNLIDSMFYGMIFTPVNYHRPEIASFGNGTGAFMQGRVVDMFYFPLFEGQFPSWLPIWGGQNFEFFQYVFNVADAAVTTGVLILVLFQKKLVHQRVATTN